MYPVIDKQQFLILSASIHYQLSGKPVNWRGILALARDRRHSYPGDSQLLELLAWLNEAYGGSTRRLGPLAIIHPIRSASLLFRSVRGCPNSDLATAMLHDKLEDLPRGKPAAQDWDALEQRYQKLLGEMDPSWRMHDRIAALTRQPHEDYFTYLDRVLDCAQEIPELVRVKLADRLDNTLDLSIDLQSETADIDCMDMIFDTLFTGCHVAQRRTFHHPIPGKINGSRRLYQLYKNVVFLSVLRRRSLDGIDQAAFRLFDALAAHSLEQARSVLVHIFVYHICDIAEQRAILHEAMDYCQQGRIRSLTPINDPHRLDGLFDSYFAHSDRKLLGTRLAELYRNKSMMALIALAMSAIFSSFRNDPSFLIEGIGGDGLER